MNEYIATSCDLETNVGKKEEKEARAGKYLRER